MEGGLRDPAKILGECQLAERRAISDELLQGRLGKPEVIPPLGLGLPPVPVQDPGEQPLRPLRIAPLQAVRRQPDPQGVLTGTGFGLSHRKIVRWRAVDWLWPGHDAIGEQRRGLQASLLEPVAEKEVRDAVIAVVRRDRIEDRGVARLHPALVLDDAEPGLGDATLAFGHVEGLELLDRIALDARADSLADDVVVEVHEDAPAEEDVDLVFARRVALHQALEGTRLIAAVVIDCIDGSRTRRSMTLSTKRSRSAFSLARSWAQSA